MARTKIDICTMALRHLGIVSAEEALQAEDYNLAQAALEEASDRLTTGHSLTLPADLNATPDGLAHALSRLVAVYVAPHYAVPAEMESRAVMRVRSYLLRDDREDYRDTDEDGTVTEDEADAADRAAFY